MVVIVGVRLWMRILGRSRRRTIRHPHHAGLAVQLEEHLNFAIFIGVRHGLEPQLHRLAFLQLDPDLFRRLHAIEIGQRRQYADRAVITVAAHIVHEHLGIHQVAAQILVIDFEPVELLRDFRAHGLQILWRQRLAGALRKRGFVLQDLRLQRGGKAIGRLAEPALEEIDDGIGKCEFGVRLDIVLPDPR